MTSPTCEVMGGGVTQAELGPRTACPRCHGAGVLRPTFDPHPAVDLALSQVQREREDDQKHQDAPALYLAMELARAEHNRRMRLSSRLSWLLTSVVTTLLLAAIAAWALWVRFA